MERFEPVSNHFVHPFKADGIASDSSAYHKIEIDWYIAFLTAR